MKKFFSLFLALIMALSVISIPTVSAKEIFTDADNVEINMVGANNVKALESTLATEPTESTGNTDSTEATDPTEPTMPMPNAVTNLKVSSTTTTSVTLKWDKSNNATKYYIYRANSKANADGNYTYNLYKTVSVTTFTDKNLKPGEVNRYKVSAANNDNESKALKIIAVTKLSAPKGFKATNVTASIITMKWDKVENAESYNIYRKKGSDKNYAHIAVVNGTSYTNKGLADCTQYSYMIQAKRTVNKVEYLGLQSKFTKTTDLKAVSKLTVKSATTKKISLSWSAVQKADSYLLYRRSENDKSAKLICTTKKLKYVDTKVVSALGYTYKVKAVKTVNGKKIYGGSAIVVTSAGAQSVGKVKVSSYAYKGLFTWNAVKGVDGYDIFLKKDNGKEVLKGTTTGTSFLTQRHLANKTFIYKIKAYKKVNGKKIYSVAKMAKVKIVSTAYGKSVGDDYIEVCTETQTVSMYINNKLYAKTPVVTGYYKVHDTTPGYHKIISKKSPARLRGSAGNDSWDVEVNYWLGFTSDGQGLHDSTWRYSGYGGSIYKYDGSHGCVNTPISAMKKMYKKAYVGMPVIVY